MQKRDKDALSYANKVKDYCKSHGNRCTHCIFYKTGFKNYLEEYACRLMNGVPCDWKLQEVEDADSD